MLIGLIQAQIFIDFNVYHFGFEKKVANLWELIGFIPI